MCSISEGWLLFLLSVDEWIISYDVFVRISICGKERLLLEGHVISNNWGHMRYSGKCPKWQPATCVLSHALQI